jgi:hypothetical protein
MRILFAHAPMTESQLRAAVAEPPAALYLDDDDLHGALNALCDQRWLLRTGEAGSESEPEYRVNFRTKARDTGAARKWQVLDFES